MINGDCFKVTVTGTSPADDIPTFRNMNPEADRTEKDEVDINSALFKLRNIIGCETMPLEGGRLLTQHF